MEQCDILYIHATKNPLGQDHLKYPVMPMGIIGISNGLIAREIRVIGINLAIEKHLDAQFALAQALKNYQYKILMTDLHWYEHAFGAIYVAEQSKKINPNIPVVMGGYTSTIFAHEIMDNFSCVDYIITGDSDLPAVMLADYLLGRSRTEPCDIPNLVYREGANAVHSEKTWIQTDLDTVDFIHTDFIEHASYIPLLGTSGKLRKTRRYWLCIARGCKYNCSYCCGAKSNMDALFRRCNVLTRSPEKIASDFYELSQNGIEQICPSHDFQMFGKKYYKDVFSHIRQTGIKPGMYLELFQLPTKEYIDDMLQTFDRDQLVLAISPISGNEQLRRENGKLFSNDDLYEIVDYIQSNGIALQLYYTLNIVGETETQFMDTYFQMMYLCTAMGLPKKCISYQRVVLDPLAPMRKDKRIESQYNSFMDYYRYCQLETGRLDTTGFDDHAELSCEKKQEYFQSI